MSTSTSASAPTRATLLLAAGCLGLLLAPCVAAVHFADRAADERLESLRLQVVDYRDYAVRLESELEQLTSYAELPVIAYYEAGGKCYAGRYRDDRAIGRSDVELHPSFCLMPEGR